MVGNTILQISFSILYLQVRGGNYHCTPNRSSAMSPFYEYIYYNKTQLHWVIPTAQTWKRNMLTIILEKLNEFQWFQNTKGCSFFFISLNFFPSFFRSQCFGVLGLMLGVFKIFIGFKPHAKPPQNVGAPTNLKDLIKFLQSSDTLHLFRVFLLVCI